MATSRRISLNCAGAGSTAGSRGSPTVSTRSRRGVFARWLKGLARGVDEEPPVRVCVMGGGSGRRNRDGRLEHGGRWRSAAEWPLPQTRWTKLYFHADRSLSTTPAAGSGTIDYAFDPHNPRADRGRRDQLG